MVVLVLREDDGEYGVRPAGGLVHVGGRDRASLVALVHQLVDVLVGGDGQLGQVLHVRPEQRVLADAEVAAIVRVQEIADSLAVDLHVGNLKLKVRQCAVTPFFLQQRDRGSTHLNGILRVRIVVRHHLGEEILAQSGGDLT